MTTHETWGLTWGDLDWSPQAQPSLASGEVRVDVYSVKRGRPVPVVEAVASLLQDGALERITRHENRDLTVLLCLHGIDGAKMAAYEAAIYRQCQDEISALLYTPADGFGAPAIFDVVWADAAPAEADDWDLAEVLWGRRNYEVTFRALPFARSVNPFLLEGATSAAAPATTVIDTGASAAGWSASIDGVAVTSVNGAIRMPVSMRRSTTYSTQYHDRDGRARRTGLVDMSTTPYLSVDWKIESSPGGTVRPLKAYADGSELTRLSTVNSPDVAGYSRTLFLCPDPSVTVFEFEPDISVYNGGSSFPTVTALFDNVTKTNQGPTLGTRRQKVATVEVPGSARTPGSLQISHLTSTLGMVLAYTCPELANGYVPALSLYGVSSTSSDSTLISGSSRTSSQTYDVPASSLPPGPYQLIVKVRRNVTSSASTKITAVASTRVNGVDLAPTQTRSLDVTLPPSGSPNWRFITVGSFVLPPTAVPEGSSALVRIALSLGSSATEVDEAWLFYLPDDGSAHLSMIDCGTGSPATGGSSSRLWLDAATPALPYPAAYVGTQADRSDARGVDGTVAIWDEHQFPPGSNQIFVVTTNALDALVQLGGWARWLTHPES